MIWRIRFGDGTWSWTTRELSNGWKACVTDQGASPTVYGAHAVHIGLAPLTRMGFAGLREAKMAALELVMAIEREQCPAK